MRQSPYSYGRTPPNRKRLWVLLAIVVVVSVLLSLLASLMDSSTDSETMSATVSANVAYEDEATATAWVEEEAAATAWIEEAPTITPSPTEAVPTAEPTAGSDYQAIQTAYANESTDDWVAYARSLVGTEVEWSGALLQAHSSTEWWVNVNASAAIAMPQVVLHVDASEAAPEEGSMLAFSGRITRIAVQNKAVMVHLDNVQITDINR
ncbi:MAG: hypothetical protein LLG44_08915 [Chloroflexi bacterium]|nr:hypothetical protein [Chloroflexota bacterium]